MNRQEPFDCDNAGEHAARPWAAFVLLFVIVVIPELDMMVRVVQNGGAIEDPGVSEGSNVAVQISRTCLGAWGAASLLAGRRRRFGIRGVLGVLLLAFAGLLFASALWADDTMLVIKRSAVFAMVLLAALAIADRFSADDMLRLGFGCAIACLGIGLFAELILHKFAPFSADYRFGGTIHPNNEGWNCGTLCLCAICLAAESRRARWPLYGVAAAAMGFLLLTGSRTALGSTLAALVAFQAIRMPRLRLVSLGLMAAAGLALLALSIDESKIAQAVLLNREEDDEESSAATLTGRTVLWQEFGDEAAKRPLLGYGYGGFWTPERIMDVLDEKGWVITHPHCGFLDIALDLGFLAPRSLRPSFFWECAVISAGSGKAARSTTPSRWRFWCCWRRTCSWNPAFASAIRPSSWSSAWHL